MNKEISLALRGLGIPADLLGHEYLKCAIQFCLDDESYIHAITKRLYPDVAEKCNTTFKRTERAIRHAIEVGWDRSEVSALQHYFGPSAGVSQRRPTNSEFIATVVEQLRMEQEAAG
jgi:two-component system response regulator (stage 0 sporulation protein A)